jgi:hypothetical protein
LICGIYDLLTLQRTLTNLYCRLQLSSVSLQMSERFAEMDAQSRNIITALLGNQTSVARDLQEQTFALTQMLNRTEVVIINQTRAIIMDAIRSGGVTSQTSEADQRLLTGVRTQEADIRSSIEIDLLQDLDFSTMNDRQCEVSEAHKKTFGWLFDNSLDNAAPWKSLTNWLRSSEGIYWINGKAGSGKSTLMRYIYDHDQTYSLLEEWAAPKEPTLASFFFWNSGTLEQRSQSGLMRTLLFETLNSHRELIPIVLPWQWAKEYSRHMDGIKDKVRSSDFWHISKLKAAFRILVAQNIIPIKMCWFIDGLDEYEGDHEEISELFRAAARSNPNVKICISSRPLLAFEDAFRTCPGLRLQDLTLRDINEYVSDKLANHPRYRKLAESANNKKAAAQLIQDIVAKADGVFLWVTLVVKSLLAGLGNRDGIKDLQRRLSLLPNDLESLYAHMLLRIDPFYQEKASEMFQLIRASRELMPVYYDGDSTKQMTLFALALADEDDYQLAVKTPVKLWNTVDIQERCEIMADRLKCRCAGLLEIQEFDPAAPGSMTRNISSTIRADSKVQYLHRTVKDYLEKPDIWNSILVHTSGSGFDANSRMLSSCVLQLKTSMISNDKYRLWRMALDAMSYAYQADTQLGISNAELLDQLDIAMSTLYKTPQGGHWSSNSPNKLSGYITETWNSNMLSFAVQFGLAAYVKEKLAEDIKHGTRKKGRPLVAYALCPLPLVEDYPANAKVVEMLRHYCPKNVLYNDTEHVLAEAVKFQAGKRKIQTRQLVSSDKSWERERVEMFRLLLEHHYDVSQRSADRMTPFPDPPTVYKIIEAFGTGLSQESMQVLESATPISQVPEKPVTNVVAVKEERRRSKTSFLRRIIGRK